MRRHATQQTAHDEGMPANLRALYKWRWRSGWRLLGFNYLRKCVDAITGCLPDVVRVALRASRPVARKLDYAKADIYIYTDSWIEYEKRANSCAKEPETVDWLETHIKPDDVVYDVGANVGAYSLLIGKLFQGKAKVYAFEPSFATFAQLSRNVYLNKVGDAVFPMHVALSDQTSLSYFNYSNLDTGTALHALETEKPETSFKAVHRQPILCFTIDEMIELFRLPYPNHIKLDVDGIEHAILKGAGRAIKNEKLRSIIVESEESRPGAGAIHDLLISAGFELEYERVHNDNPLHKGPYVKNSVYRRRRQEDKRYRIF